MREQLTLTVDLKRSYLKLENVLINIHKEGFKQPLIFLPLNIYFILGGHPSNGAYLDFVKNNPYEGFTLFGVKFIATDEDTIATNGFFTLEIIL